MAHSCPACGASENTRHTVPVDTETFVQHAADDWPDTYAGIIDATAVEESDGYGLNVRVDNDAYPRHNYFERRNEYTCRSGTTIEDLEDGWVAVRFHGGTVRPIPAYHCAECPTIWRPAIGVISTVSTPTL